MSEDQRVSSLPNGANVRRARVQEQPRSNRVQDSDVTIPAAVAAMEGSLAEYGWRRIPLRPSASADDQGQFRNPLFQESVTLTAKMWPEDDGLEVGPDGSSEQGPWRISGDQLPLVVGAVAGGILLVMFIVAAVLWRFCILPRRDKEYRVRMGGSADEANRSPATAVPSHSAVFADTKNGRWAYSSRLVTNGEPTTSDRGSPDEKEPSAGGCPGKWVYEEPLSAMALTRGAALQDDDEEVGYARCLSALGDSTLFPQISEFSPGTCFQYASSGVLDERLPASENASPWLSARNGSYVTTFAECDADTLAALRSRSLPASSRARARWLAETNAAVAAAGGHLPPGANPVVIAADAKCLDELYAKVNFSKKRKNRMRRDEAAIIALSKSRSELLAMDLEGESRLDCSSIEAHVDPHSSGMLKDDAVIVYDERTAV